MRLHGRTGASTNASGVRKLDMAYPSAFWSSAVHDLRHPLSTMILQLQLLERRVVTKPPEKEELMGVVRELQATTIEMKTILNEVQNAVREIKRGRHGP